jgi:hypothetical protein
MRIKPNRISYSRFEKTFLRFLDQLDWTSVLDVAESQELIRAEKELANLCAEIANTEQRIEKLTDLLYDTPSQSLRKRLLAAESA